MKLSKIFYVDNRPGLRSGFLFLRTFYLRQLNIKHPFVIIPLRTNVLGGIFMTDRESQIYDTIRDYISANGYPPTVREIGSLVGLKSSSVVHYYLLKIRDKGYVSFVPGKPRTLRVIDDV